MTHTDITSQYNVHRDSTLHTLYLCLLVRWGFPLPNIPQGYRFSAFHPLIPPRALTPQPITAIHHEISLSPSFSISPPLPLLYTMVFGVGFKLLLPHPTNSPINQIGQMTLTTLRVVEPNPRTLILSLT